MLMSRAVRTDQWRISSINPASTARAAQFRHGVSGHAVSPSDGGAQHRLPASRCVACRVTDCPGVRRAIELVQLDGLVERLTCASSRAASSSAWRLPALVFAPPVVARRAAERARSQAARRHASSSREFHRRVGLTFIYVTHDQEEALSMSDRVAILNHGRLLQLGAPAGCTNDWRRGSSPSSWAKRISCAASSGRTGVGGFALRSGRGRSSVQSARSTAKVGDKILLALWPETDRAVVGDGSRPANVIDSTIVSWSYLGTSFHLLVDTKDAGRFAVTVPTWRHGTPPAVGATIRWVGTDASIQVEGTTKECDMSKLQTFAEDRAEILRLTRRSVLGGHRRDGLGRRAPGPRRSCWPISAATQRPWGAIVVPVREKKTGAKMVIPAAPVRQAGKIKTMVQARNVTWDVVDPGSAAPASSVRSASWRSTTRSSTRAGDGRLRLQVRRLQLHVPARCRRGTAQDQGAHWPTSSTPRSIRASG